MTRRSLFALAAMAQAQPVERLESDWTLASTVAIRANLHHVQGIDLDAGVLWVSSVDARARKGYLTRVALPSGETVAQVEVQQGDQIHPGGIAHDGDSLWIPVAEYDPDGPSSIERRDPRTLALLSSFEVADHIGCVAVAPGEIVGGSWGSRMVYRWRTNGEAIGRRPNPSPVQWQDLKMEGGLLVGSGPVSKTEGAIEWLEPASLRVVRRITTGATSRGVNYTQEGMALRRGRLYLLPEDHPSRLFEFVRRA